MDKLTFQMSWRKIKESKLKYMKTGLMKKVNYESLDFGWNITNSQ